MESELIAKGLELMLVGMGTVFVFLTLLVGATTIMSALAMRWVPPQPAQDGPSDAEIVAISAAISRHRSRQTESR